MTGESTTTVAPPRRQDRLPPDEWHERRWRAAGLLLVILLVAIGCTALVAGEKQSSYGDPPGGLRRPRRAARPSAPG